MHCGVGFRDRNVPEGSGVAGTKWKVEHAMMVHETQGENVEVRNKCVS